MVSPGPLETRAASGLKGFDQLLASATAKALVTDLIEPEDVGMTTAYLVTLFARLMNGDVIYIDGCFHIMG